MPKKAKPSGETANRPVSRTKPGSRRGARTHTLPYSPVHSRPKSTSPSVPVLDTDGKPAGKMSLPADLFAAKINKPLMAQAVRVYLANQREGSASTKTRGEVEGSTRKIFRQKGTGRARHGAIRAPIFVGGGIVFGPKPRDYHLDLPKKMKRAALTSALTSKLQEQSIVVVDGFGNLEPKTKIMAQALTATVGDIKSMLLVVSKDAANVVRAARNIEGVDIMPVQNLHAYSVLNHQKLVFMKEAILSLRGAIATKQSHAN